jgi:hypothetical protein
MATNTITLATAQGWAAKWQSDPANKIKAFLIPKEDITQLFQYDGVSDVRTYFGMDESGNQKLMIVGVDANGNDLIDDARQQFIYDFAQRCPDVCDTRSPLFNPRP